jgi:hypothetical protein
MSLLDALLLDPYRMNIWIASRTDGVAGSGTQNDPYDGSTAARLDTVLNSLVASTRIHFGPGTFQINGYQDGAVSGWLKSGMKIVGSGMDVTKLQMVGVSTTNKHYFAIGHPLSSGGQPNLIDFFEISDLTIDCNLAGATTLTACGAVRVMGNHARTRRIKVINWGKKASGPDCFVIAMITADPASGATAVIDTGIEECIAIQPDANTSSPITVFHAGPKDDSGSNAEGFGTGPFIRNCFCDCAALTNPLTFDIRGLSMAWCKAGIVEGNQIHNTKYGGPYVSKSSSRDLVVRNNFYKNVAKGPFWNLATLTATSLTALARDLTYDSSGKTAVATLSNHGLLAGDRVKFAISSGPAQYVGIFVVLNVPATDKFRYVMISDPGSGGVTGPTMQKIFGVAKLVVEGNTIELATGSTGQIGVAVDDSSLSPQTPDYAHGDVIVRDNKFRYLDGTFDPGSTGYGIQVNGAKNLLVRNNVVESTQAHPIANRRCGSVKYFNNKEPDGTLIQGYNADTDKEYDELETDAEDALVLALFNRR